MSLPPRPIAVIVEGRPGIPIRLEAAQGHFRDVTNADGYVLFRTVPGDMAAANLFVDDPDSEFYGIVIALPDGPHQCFIGAPSHPTQPGVDIILPPLVPKAPPISALLPVHAGRADFFTADGARHVIVGSTELLLGWRYDQDGAAALRPILQQRRLCQFNNLRVLWQKGPGSNGLTAPWLMPIEKLRPFLALAAEYGYYIQGVNLADCQSVNPNEADQQARVQAIRAATVGVANLIEQLGNEYDKNGHDPRHFSKPTDRLAANSSSTEGGPDAPYWDFFGFSGQRSPLNHAIREYGPVEFLYAEGEPGWGGVPAICDEGMKPGINSSDPRDFERAGAQARSGCGGRFHSDAGTAGNSRLFTDLELACAVAFVRGLGV